MWMSPVALRALADVTSGGTGIDPLTALSQLGIGALIAGPFVYLWRSGHSDVADKEAEIRRLRDEMYKRERDLNDATLPRLVEAITTLRETQRGMGSALRAPDYGEVTRRLEAAVDRLTDRR